MFLFDSEVKGSNIVDASYVVFAVECFLGDAYDHLEAQSELGDYLRSLGAEGIDLIDFLVGAGVCIPGVV